MDPTKFPSGTAPTAIAAQLGLQPIRLWQGSLYARDGDLGLFRIGPEPGREEVFVEEVWEVCTGDYVGEEFHSPREAAEHAGLTVIDEYKIMERVVALDGFGRKYSIHRTGNGPMGSRHGWATPEEMQRWQPQVLPARRTTT